LRDVEKVARENDEMSLQDFQTYLAIVKDIFTILASVIAGVVAIVGLQTWKKQIKGKVEYELAQRLLMAVYKVRDALYYVRNPFMTGSETSQALKSANIEQDPSEPTLSAKSVQAVYQQRWIKVQESWSNMDIALLEAEALWGNEITDLAKLLSNCTVTLRVNITKYLRNLQNERVHNPEKDEEIDEVIYGFTGDEENNKFSAKIVEIVHKFEKYLKPRLKL